MTEFSVAFQTDHPLSAYGPLAAAVEAYGFDMVTVYNDLLFQPAWLPLLEMARQTRRVRLGPAAVNPFTCHPVNIAGNIALIDEASQGRAYLGLARGGWLDFLGMNPKRPARALREALECVRHLLACKHEPYTGEIFQLAGGDSLRWSILRPDIPFLLGSWGEQAIGACINLISEVKIGGTTNAKAIARARGIIGDALQRAGRAANDVAIVVGAVCVVDTDGAAARALARARTAFYLPIISALDHTLGIDPELLARINQAVAALDYDGAGRLISDDMLRRLAFAGTPDEVVEQANTLVAAGAGRIEFGAPHGLTAEKGLHLLGTRVLPALRAA